ncbi:MAG TPA: hypothetical protein VM118_07135 [Acidobacteriota bacterium]|nr:hypothetical protein [Acidobacteriota bacterium]
MIEERWRSEYRGRLVVSSGRSLLIVDLQTDSITRVEVPDSITIEAHVDQVCVHPLYRTDNGVVYFISKEPFTGVWTVSPETGRTELVYRFRVNACSFIDDEATLTSLGDTVLGSMTVVWETDVGFDIAPATGRLYCTTKYEYEGWYPGCNWTVSNLKPRSRYPRNADPSRFPVSDGWVISVFNEKQELDPIAQFESRMGCRQSISARGRYISMATKCCPRTIEVVDVARQRSSTPVLPRRFRSATCAASFSPDERVLATAAQTSSYAVLVAQAPDFDRFEVLCEMPGLMVYDVAWTPDSKWIVAYARGVNVGSWGGREPYYVAIELATGEYAKIPLSWF